jgi:arsenate reductase
MKVTISGIPTCDTCRKARAWLTACGVSHEWVDLRTQPPSAKSIGEWVKALSAKALRNSSGGSYRALGSEKESWSDAEWIAAFARDAMLIKRPVLEIDGRARAVGFKSAEWQQLIGV